MDVGGNIPGLTSRRTLNRPPLGVPSHIPRAGSPTQASHLPVNTQIPDVSLEGFQGIAMLQQEQIDISLEGFQGIAMLQQEQIDISLEGFQGIAILQVTYP